MSSFANVAGRAAFVLGLDKSELDAGLPRADRQFDQATARMERSADRATAATSRTATAIGGMGGVGLAGRLGLIGIAANAGLQGLNAASDALRVTGYEAHTTEGRFRNLGAELARGNIVGGIQALYTSFIASDEALQKLESSSEAAGNQVEIDGQKAIAAALGLKDYAKQLRAASAAATAYAAQQALDFSVRKENVVDVNGGSVAVTRGTSPNDRGGLQGVGGTAGLALSPEYKDPFLARQQKADTAALNAQLTKTLSDDLKAQRELAAIAKARVAAATKGTDDYRKLYAAYVQQVVAANSIQDQIDAAAAQAAAERARKAEEAARKAQAAREREARARERAAREAEAYRKRNVDAVRRAVDTRVGPYANTSQGFANGKPVGSGADGTSVDEFGRMAQEFLRQLSGQAKAYASNVTVIQHMHANTPPFAAARDARRAAEAAFG